jgi:hypothetical protein
MSGVRWLGLALGVLSSVACATAQNYMEPTGPRFEAPFGEVRDAEPALRIVTFNIEHGRRVRQAIAGLTSHPDLRGADVLLLQEMTADGVEAIARALSLNAVYYPASRLEGRDMGEAVLSPWPVEALAHRARVPGALRFRPPARHRRLIHLLPDWRTPIALHTMPSLMASGRPV